MPMLAGNTRHWDLCVDTETIKFHHVEIGVYEFTIAVRTPLYSSATYARIETLLIDALDEKVAEELAHAIVFNRFDIQITEHLNKMEQVNFTGASDRAKNL